MTGWAQESWKRANLIIQRYTLRIFLAFCLFTTVLIYLSLINEQNNAINPSILRADLVQQGKIIELRDWQVEFLDCTSVQSHCLSMGLPISMQLPGKNEITREVLAHNNRPNRAIITHELSAKEQIWIDRRQIVSIVMPRMVHSYTRAEKLRRNNPEVGFAANVSFSVDSVNLSRIENPLTFEIDFTGYDWFGPANLPIVLAEPDAIATYESLSSLSVSSAFLTKQLDIGLPLIISGMALILDHSQVFPSLAALAVIRSMRSYRAFDREQEIPVLTTWESQLILFFTNVFAIPLLLIFVAIASDLVISRKQILGMVGISTVILAIYSILSPSYEFESDLWLDAIGCILALPLVCLGGYRELKVLKVNSVAGKIAPPSDWRNRDARRIQVCLRSILSLFALLATSYANLSDLQSISEVDFKQNLQWGHTVLIPIFVIVAMIDIGSITRKMRRFAKSMVERALIDRDLVVGKKMQSLLLPPRRGESTGWRWRTFHYPSMTLAGDWYDVRRITTSNNRDYILCCVVDVTGHGVSAALISTAISSHWSMWCQSRIGTAGPVNDKEREKIALEAPNHIHQSLMVLRENSGCTAAFLVLEEASGRVSYCTAGHPGIVAFSQNGGLKYMFTPGTRPGFSESQVGWTARSDDTEIGDKFFVYSDGVVPSDLSFSVWLKRLKSQNDGQSMALAVLNDMRRNKSAFRKKRNSEDDMSLVILERIA
jgi:serine phosphatase RsbU (regulator of sigma subunit)